MLRELKNSPATYRGQQRLRRKRTAMIAFVLILVLLLLVTVGVVIYNWYVGQNAKVTVVDTPSKITNVITKPKAIAQNQAVGVYITSLTSPLAAGSNASVSIRTLPEAACSIEVLYNGMKSTDTGLAPKVADEYGYAGWSWTVEKGQPVGKWPVNITCAHNDTSGFMRGDLVITAS